MVDQQQTLSVEFVESLVDKIITPDEPNKEQFTQESFEEISFETIKSTIEEDYLRAVMLKEMVYSTIKKHFPQIKDFTVHIHEVSH